MLVACEFSGIVREAFKAKGHDAWSCDLLDTEIPGQHYKGDVFDIINDGWDLMIAHPPCTFLSNAGIAYFNETKYGAKAIERKEKRLEGADFFIKLYNCSISKIAIENPVGWMNLNFRKPDQIVRPFYFGESIQKNICLWLKNLPLLIHNKQKTLFELQTHTDNKPQPAYIDKSVKPRYFTDSISGYSKDAKKNRSRFFPSIANAMADQWGNL